MTAYEPAAAVSTYLREFSDSIALLEGARRFDLGHLRSVLTGRAMFNRVYDAAFPSRVTAEDVSIVSRFAREENVRPVWLLDSDHIDDETTRELQRHGFAPTARWSGMWYEGAEVSHIEPPAGLVVSRVQDLGALQVWIRICAEVEGFSPAQEETFADLFTMLMHQSAAWTHLIAREADRPVATASMFLTGRIAAVDWVNTIDAARRRGIARYLVSMLLREMRASYDLAVLTSTKIGEPVYRQLGFRECSRITAYRGRVKGED